MKMIEVPDLHDAFCLSQQVALGPQTHLSDLFDLGEYQEAVAAGLVRVREHPTEPLLIHNYTQAATWNQAWNPVTLTCRGLITHRDTGAIVARPFQKFFNHGQAEAPEFTLEDEVVVMEKADGSLAVHYPTSAGYAIATRGSFTSDQALWATAHYRSTYAETFIPNPHWTYLYEIIAPHNRIVVDYGDFSDLVLLGAVETATGRTVPLPQASEGWPGPTVDIFPHGTFAEVLKAPERSNAEGFVVWRPSTDSRVKIKHSEYLRLHRLIYGVNERHVWDVLSHGDDLGAAFQGAPDEFHEWVKGVASRLTSEHVKREREARTAYEEALRSLPQIFSRREFAESASKHHLKSLLFLLHDGKDIGPALWQSLRPSGGATLRSAGPDAD